MELSIWDLGASIWLFGCWFLYSVIARRRARHSFCIASVLHKYRQQWMENMMQRENRIADASLLSNLERNASFLASTAILVIAGLVTTLASVEKVHAMLETVPFFNVHASPVQLQFKIIVLLMIFIYAFFTFTWAMRQYGFCAVLVGAAPIVEEGHELQAAHRCYAHYTAKVIDQAGHSYNYGLRAYYFSLAVLTWLLSAWVFIGAVAMVVSVLYGREFHSKSLRALIQVSDLSLDDLKKSRSCR